jgi:hypothetical protein
LTAEESLRRPRGALRGDQQRIPWGSRSRYSEDSVSESVPTPSSCANRRTSVARILAWAFPPAALLVLFGQYLQASTTFDVMNISGMPLNDVRVMLGQSACTVRQVAADGAYRCSLRPDQDAFSAVVSFDAADGGRVEVEVPYHLPRAGQAKLVSIWITDRRYVESRAFLESDVGPLCPSACGALCAGRPRPPLPDGCPAPLCVCPARAEPGLRGHTVPPRGHPAGTRTSVW